MEHALGGVREGNLYKITVRLNPYCNGTCSRRKYNNPDIKKTMCLNPYCNGTCSRRH